MFDNRYNSNNRYNGDQDSYNAAMEREMATRDEIENRELIIDLGEESEIERARRRAPITEPKCCSDSKNFHLVSSLDRDMDTGYFTGDYYMCGSCGSRICEEDYAAIVAYEDSKGQWAPIDDDTAGSIVPKVDARPVTGVPARKKVA